MCKCNRPEWIPTKKGLPEYDHNYFERDGEDRQYIVTIKGASASTVLSFFQNPEDDDGTWYDEAGTTYNVTAWMPLPDVYEEIEAAPPRKNLEFVAYVPVLKGKRVGL